jgi:lipopolysaccharide transport system ATP-binding protein
VAGHPPVPQNGKELCGSDLTMSDIAIKVENLGKSYLVGHNTAHTERYTALRDVIARNTRNLARKTRDMVMGKPIVQGDEIEEFWALKDINFEIKRGDRVGIIGRNGAGKSTLLKILSRITEPSQGRISINGRIASLLEVGTGFHPELTGRENIYLNGAILGMSRNEISRKFDEIVDFSEVERFLDTPVKRYSSGMYVRLAFAVAAHLEPEILIVDEVLAVGDVQFQEKCLGKMRSVSNEGRTILFVSHNLTAIEKLTNKSIFLKNGILHEIGPTESILDSYKKIHTSEKQNYYSFNKPIQLGQKATINAAYFEQDRAEFYVNESIYFILKITSMQKLGKVRISLTILTDDDQPVGSCFGNTNIELEQGSDNLVEVSIRDHKLAPGSYSINLSIGTGNNIDGFQDFDSIFSTLYFEIKAIDKKSNQLIKWEKNWGRLMLEQTNIITSIRENENQKHTTC